MKMLHGIVCHGNEIRGAEWGGKFEGDIENIKFFKNLRVRNFLSKNLLEIYSQFFMKIS